MTRKHYQLLAEALKGNKPENNKDMIIQWRSDVVRIAVALRLDNINFDYDRFYKACNMED